MRLRITRLGALTPHLDARAMRAVIDGRGARLDFVTAKGAPIATLDDLTIGDVLDLQRALTGLLEGRAAA